MYEYPVAVLILLNEWYQINIHTSGHQGDIPYYQAILYDVILTYFCDNETRYYTKRQINLI